MEKMTFRQKLDNFWYHNKFAVIVVSVFAVFIIVSTTQMLFKKSPDANLLYIGTASISFTSQDKLQESIALVMKEDYNDDGRRYVDYIELTVLDPEKAQNFDKTTFTDRQIDSVAGERFTAELIAGDSMIYLASENYYQMALEQKVLMPLSEIVEEVPEKARDEYSIYLRDLDIFYLDGFNKLPSDTVVFVRYPVSLADSKKELEKREECNLNVFRDILEYTHPDKPEDPLETATRLSTDDFIPLWQEWCRKNSIEIPETSPIVELSTDEIFEKTGATVYKCNSRTFACFDQKLYSIGRSSEGKGVSDIDACDFDNNGVFDLIFTYTYTESGEKSSASVFNLSSMREDFLRLEDGSVEGAVYVLEKLSDSEFEIWTTDASLEDLTYSLSSADKSRLVAVILSQDGAIVKKTYK